MIGENIAKRRKELGLTQAELGRAVGIQSVSKIEAGKVGLTVERLYQIAEHLYCTPQELMDGSFIRELSAAEEQLILNYREADERGKMIISNIARDERNLTLMV